MVSVFPENEIDGNRYFYTFVAAFPVIRLFDTKMHLPFSKGNTDKSVIYGRKQNNKRSDTSAF